MKIATWNVNGIRARETQLQEWVATWQPDVICLQEIKARPDQVPESICNLDGYSCYWHGASGYSGVGLHVRRASFPDEPVYAHPSFDMETRIVEVRLGNLVVTSVYVPNGGKDFVAKMSFLGELERYAATRLAEGVDLVICGDLNVARADIDVHPKERKPGVIGQRPDERELIEQILFHGMVDVGRQLRPDDEEFFTWWAPWRNMKQRNIGWRIDYILASPAVAGTAVEIVSQREIGTSDHGPLMATFGG